MEALDKVKARMAHRLHDSVLEPAHVSTVGDIKRVISEFDPAKNPVSATVPIHTQLEVNDGGKRATYAVSANTRSKSKRDHLIEGLQMIQHRMESQPSTEHDNNAESVIINGTTMRPPKMGNGAEGYTWVDPLIRQWLGAVRDGVVIYWDLDDGYRYKYNIFEHKLTRIQREEDNSASFGSISPD